jgi:hypothetical protein
MVKDYVPTVSMPTGSGMSQLAQYHIPEIFLRIILFVQYPELSRHTPCAIESPSARLLIAHIHQRFFKYGIWKSGGVVPLTFNLDIRWK